MPYPSQESTNQQLNHSIDTQMTQIEVPDDSVLVDMVHVFECKTHVVLEVM